MKLRNAATKAMKQGGYGEGYQYAHDDDGDVAGRDVPARRARGQALLRAQGHRLRGRAQGAARGLAREEVSCLFSPLTSYALNLDPRA